jgi:hypothetical protein
MILFFEVYKDALYNVHWIFVLVIILSQVFVSVYLTIYEIRKMMAIKNKWQLLMIIYNTWQVIMPFFAIILTTIGGTFIMEVIFYGINSTNIIMGLLVLFYKIQYLNFASFYITRMFLIISDIIPLILMIFVA